jgi:hypothetical protein
MSAFRGKADMTQTYRNVCLRPKADILVSDAYLSATDRQAQLLIETGATEPFQIVLSLAVVFDGHLVRDTRCPFMTGSVAIDLACDNSGDHSR